MYIYIYIILIILTRLILLLGSPPAHIRPVGGSSEGSSLEIAAAAAPGVADPSSVYSVGAYSCS